MDLKKLRALAEDATGWSNCNQAWIDHSEDAPAAVVGHIDDEGNAYPVSTIDCDQYYAAQDSIKLAKFYAAANPETVLMLISTADTLRAELEKAQAILGELVALQDMKAELSLMLLREEGGAGVEYDRRCAAAWIAARAAVLPKEAGQ